MMLPPQSTPASQLLQLLHCCTLRSAGKQMPQHTVSECGNSYFLMQFVINDNNIDNNNNYYIIIIL